MRNVCDVVVEVLRIRSADAPLNLEEILSHVIVRGALDRTRPHDTTEIADALLAEMRRRAETHLPQRFTTTDGVWWGLVNPPPPQLRPVGRGWMAQLVRDVRWRSTTAVGARLESFRYDGSSATALLRASRQHGDGDVTLAGQIAGTLVVPQLRGGLRVTADVDGDVIVDGPVAGDVTISGQVAGTVHVRGAIDGTLHIASSVDHGVRIAARHVGRIDIDGQIGGAAHIAARVIDGVTVSGWVADDLTIAGTVAGGVRVAADISGRLEICKRVTGNVKVGGWILGGIDVTGIIDGELAIQSWVGGAVSITAPAATVNLGSGRFYGSIKLRPEGVATARTRLTSIRLAEFHAPVRIHCDVDTAAVDTTGAVGRSQLRCIGSNRRPFDQDVGRPTVSAAPQTRRPSGTIAIERPPVRLQPSEPDVSTPPVSPQPTPTPFSVVAAESVPWLQRPELPDTLADSGIHETIAGAAEPQTIAEPAPPPQPTPPVAEPAPPPRPPVATPAVAHGKLRVADTPLTLAELAQQTDEPAPAPKVAVPPAPPTTCTPATRAPATSVEPALEPRAPRQQSATQPPTSTRFTQPVPACASESEQDPPATSQLVLGIAWLS